MFKALAEQKAQEQGMTLSELGRMLFGSFVSGVAKPSLTISPEFLELAKSAQAEHAAGKSRRIKSKKELDQFLDSL